MLTEGQERILSLRADGLSLQETADYLGVSRETVKNTMRRIYDRLEVETAIEALHAAGLIQHGALSVERGAFQCLFGHRAMRTEASR